MTLSVSEPALAYAAHLLIWSGTIASISKKCLEMDNWSDVGALTDHEQEMLGNGGIFSYDDYERAIGLKALAITRDSEIRGLEDYVVCRDGEPYYSEDYVWRTAKTPLWGPHCDLTDSGFCFDSNVKIW
jgi:hypothetical protein